jgi:TolA-binding protein
MTRLFPRAAATAILAATLAPGVALAQSLDGAIAAYKAADWSEAAARFYEVLKFDTDEGNQAEAEYGLAQSFFKMGLYFPAIKYYENIIQAGNQHTYYFKSFEGLLEAGDALQDDLKVPAVLDKAYGNSLKKLDSAILQRIHYTIGELMYRQGKPKDARDFLGTVKKGNKDYPKAQYLLALMRLGMGRRDKGKVDRENALKHFRNILAEIPASAGGERRRLREMAVFGVARVNYEEASVMEEDNPDRKAKLVEALEYYDKIPRLHPLWGQALFEKAWVMFLQNEYGQTLGLMHSLQAPYFSDRYQPELHVLKALVYYFNCHYDRVYRALKIFEDEYGPMLEELKKVNAEERDAGLWYEAMSKSVAPGRLKADPTKVKNDGLVPIPVARDIARDPKWLKLDGTLTELRKEMAKVRGNKVIAEGPLAEELMTLLEDAEKSFVKITGKWAQGAAKKAEGDLGGFLKQGTLIRLETATAEQGWLEAGRGLQENVVRRRLPRPFIPDDTYIFWSWKGEYWADELGFYRYSIKSECID